MRTQITYTKENENQYTVYVNGNRYGELDYDKDQDCWVLWTGISYSSSETGLANTSDEGVSYEERLEDTQDEIEDEITTDRNNNRAILKHVLQDNPTHASEIEEAADDLSDYNYLIEEPLEWYNVNTGAVLGDMNYKIKVIDEAVEDYYNSDDDGLSLADVINRRFESADDFVPQR